MAEALMGIENFMAGCANALLLDVRSPAEYAQGHVPGAINLPLFTNEERAVVGTAYKQQSRKAAIKIGLDFFGPNMRRMVEEVEGLVDSKELAVSSLQFAIEKDGEINNATANCQMPTANRIYVYCWRGGMRSGAVAWLLQLYGFNVVRLQGGYKSFRGWILHQFGQPLQLQVLGGYTGSGKTEALRALQQQGEPVIDLEALARHKGSTFGNLNEQPQPTQEQFENELAIALHQLSHKCIWLEDESRRIGRLMLPAGLWEQKQEAPLSFLDLPFEQRLEFIVQQYGSHSHQQLEDGINRIAKRLGPQNTKAAIEELASGNIKACFDILLQYYDRLYEKSMGNRPQGGQKISRIQGTTTGAANVVYLTTTASYEKT